MSLSPSRVHSQIKKFKEKAVIVAKQRQDRPSSLQKDLEMRLRRNSYSRGKQVRINQSKTSSISKFKSSSPSSSGTFCKQSNINHVQCLSKKKDLDITIDPANNDEDDNLNAQNDTLDNLISSLEDIYYIDKIQIENQFKILIENCYIEELLGSSKTEAYMTSKISEVYDLIERLEMQNDNSGLVKESQLERVREEIVECQQSSLDHSSIKLPGYKAVKSNSVLYGQNYIAFLKEENYLTDKKSELRKLKLSAFQYKKMMYASAVGGLEIIFSSFTYHSISGIYQEYLECGPKVLKKMTSIAKLIKVVVSIMYTVNMDANLITAHLIIIKSLIFLHSSIIRRVVGSFLEEKKKSSNFEIQSSFDCFFVLYMALELRQSYELLQELCFGFVCCSVSVF